MQVTELPSIPDDDFDFTAELGRKIVAQYQKIVAAASVASGAGWRTMDSAPRDGTPIDVWLGNASESDVDFYCTKGSRRSPGWIWSNGKFRPVAGLPTFEVPTHWMPAPAGPSPDGSPAADGFEILASVVAERDAAIAKVELLRDQVSRLRRQIDMEPTRRANGRK
jgi:hypothetical protein